MKESIYTQLKKAMDANEIGHHESDLYVKVTEKSTFILASYEFKENVTKFRSLLDGSLWYDIPFAYDPFYKK